MKLDRLIQQSSYFSALSPEHRQAVAAVCTSRMLAKRDTLFLEGQKGDSLFLLGSGALQLVKTSEDGREIVIKTVEPGEVFGEVILFEQDAYPVTAVAVQHCDVYALQRRDFLRLLDDRAFRDDFMSILMKRLRYLAERILELTLYEVDERFFLFLERQYGRRATYEIPLSKKDIAAAIGTTPETFSRLIQRLGSESILAVQGKAYTLSPGFWDERRQQVGT